MNWNNLVNAFIWIVIIGIIHRLVSWGLEKMGLDEPFHKVANWILIGTAVIVAANVLLTLAGKPLFSMGLPDIV